MRPSNQVAGQIWNDENEDGVFSFDETLQEGMTVQLMSEDDMLLRETVTGKAGRYVFDDLEDGRYYVKVVTSIEYIFTEKNFGLDEQNDSDFNADGSTELIIFDTGETVERHIDAGLIRIGNFNSSIYPNPTSGNQIQLRSYKYARDVNSAGKLLFFDQQGALRKTVWLELQEQEGFYEKSIDISELPSGFYFLKFSQGRRSEDMKLIIID